MFRVLLATLFILLSEKAFSNESSYLDYLIEESERLQLADHPTWRKLLHFRGNEKKSQIISKDFFLAADGATSPRSELEATLTAYFEEFSGDYDQHSQCRFPARYFWLSQYLELPGYQLGNYSCTSFERWALLEKVDSISLFLVSGYFGNPASTFGHALLKLNTTAPEDKLGLFDLTINFGALVPENEHTLVYVIRGLTGGYQAGFSDRYFYTQDQVYSRTEFRDIWDYRLNLSDSQRTLLILHLWEVIGKKYTYYFLKENCAYRLAELLDLVMEEDVLSGDRFWYVPVQMFHRLKDINESRIDDGLQPIIESVTPMPSARRFMHSYFLQLDPDEHKAVKSILATGQLVDGTSMNGLTADQQIDVLDALLAYYQYKQVSEEPDPSDQTILAKNNILLERLRMPARDKTVPSPELPAPYTDSTRPLLIGAGLAYDYDNDLYPIFRWSGFIQESLSPSSLEGSELVVFNTTIGYKRSRLLIDELEILRIRKVNTASKELSVEPQRSWYLRFALDRLEQDSVILEDWNIDLGIGKSYRLLNNATIQPLVHFSAHSEESFLRIQPEVTLESSYRNFHGRMKLGLEIFDDGTTQELFEGSIQYHISENNAIRIDCSNRSAARLRLSLATYW